MWKISFGFDLEIWSCIVFRPNRPKRGRGQPGVTQIQEFLENENLITDFAGTQQINNRAYQFSGLLSRSVGHMGKKKEIWSESKETECRKFLSDFSLGRSFDSTSLKFERLVDIVFEPNWPIREGGGAESHANSKTFGKWKSENGF